MSVCLDDYAELLEPLSEHSRALLEANWHEATKVFSPRGLDNYLKGISAIRGLGRGDSLVETWIEEAPKIARELVQQPNLMGLGVALAHHFQMQNKCIGFYNDQHGMTQLG